MGAGCSLLLPAYYLNPALLFELSHHLISYEVSFPLQLYRSHQDLCPGSAWIILAVDCIDVYAFRLFMNMLRSMGIPLMRFTSGFFQGVSRNIS